MKERLKKKFNISYVLAKKMYKYTVIHKLLERHGVELGFSYKTRESSSILHTTLQKVKEKQEVHQMLSSTSFLMKGSTNKGKVENKVIVNQYCKVDEVVEEVRSFSKFLRVVGPVKADTDGLIKCLGEGLKGMGTMDILNSKNVLGVEGHPVLIGGGTDEATVNISDHNRMKGNLTMHILVRLLGTSMQGFTLYPAV